MAAANNILYLLITFTLLFSLTTTSSSSTSPVPPLETDFDNSLSTISPYAFPPANLSPVSASIPSPAPAPAPAPEVATNTATGNKPMNAWKTAGILIGVVAGMCVVVLGVVLCKKRKENVRRSRVARFFNREDYLF